MGHDRIIALRNNKTVFRDGDKVLKVFDGSFKESEVLSEALNQARVEETGLPVPSVREVTLTDGRWTIVTEYIKGKTLGALMAEQPQRCGEYISRLVDIQLEIHAKRCPELVRQRDKMIRHIIESELSATERYDLYSRLGAMTKHSKLCHGDLGPSNIMITESGEHYILDWSHASQGNGAADAARTYLLLGCDGDNESAELYLDFYCERSGAEQCYVRRWLPIVAAARLPQANEAEREYLRPFISAEYD